MSDFPGNRGKTLGECCEEGSQEVGVEAKAGWNLNEDGHKLFAEVACPTPKALELLPTVGEPFHVAHQPGRLEHETETGTRRGSPSPVGAFQRRAVEGHVELDDGELARVELQPSPAR